MKTRLCVLFGGESTEYEISLRSAASILEHLNPKRYDLTLVGITKDGRWYHYEGGIDRILKDGWYREGMDHVLIDYASKDGTLLIGKDGTYTKKPIDAVFPILHGKNGEDGTVQGLFELSGVPYVGTGLLSSAVSMDKAYTKILFAHAGIPQANWVELNRDESDLAAMVLKAESRLGYPMFVKPSNAGSSIGIGKAKDRASLMEAINTAFSFDRRIIIEEFLTGHEVECAVMGVRNAARATCAGEILAANEFYDYEAKYSDNVTSELVIPADLPKGVQETIKRLAVRAFAAVDGRGLSRVDFFVDGDTVRINEINTMPGFTSISMYPKLFMHTGMAYSEILDALIDIALDNHEKRKRL